MERYLGKHLRRSKIDVHDVVRIGALERDYVVGEPEVLKVPSVLLRRVERHLKRILLLAGERGIE